MMKGKRHHYFGYDKKKERVFAVTFLTKKDSELQEKMKMFVESNLQPIAMKNTSQNRLALKRVLQAMEREEREKNGRDNKSK